MDTDRFDDLTRTLAATGTRRRVLAALAGGLLATVGGRGVGAADLKDIVRICHKTDSGTNPIVVIEVAANAVADHLAHGDFLHDQCCLDGDCDQGQRCADGSCQGTCVDAAETCETDNDCCGSLCCDTNGICDNDCGFD
jgi:hypothetical protein